MYPYEGISLDHKETINVIILGTCKVMVCQTQPYLETLQSFVKWLSSRGYSLEYSLKGKPYGQLQETIRLSNLIPWDNQQKYS